MKVITKRIILFSILHFIMLLLCITISFSLGMDRFETGIVKETLLEDVARNLSGILGFPGMYIFTALPRKDLSSIIQWLFVISNSILWGVVLSYVYTQLRRTKE